MTAVRQKRQTQNKTSYHSPMVWWSSLLLRSVFMHAIRIQKLHPISHTCGAAGALWVLVPKPIDGLALTDEREPKGQTDAAPFLETRMNMLGVVQLNKGKMYTLLSPQNKDWLDDV